MKRYLYQGLVIILMHLLQISSEAQHSSRFAGHYTKYSTDNLIPGSKQVNTEKKPGFIFRNDINKRAVRYFISNYEKASHVTWRESAKGAAAYCLLDGIKTSVYFQKNGEYQCQIRYYFADKLSPGICQTINARFPTYTIYCVSELSEHGQTEYNIRIENTLNWKSLIFVDGEIKSIESYSKL